MLLGLLTLAIGRMSAGPPICCRMPSKAAALAGTEPTTSPASAASDALAADHVARLGAELFGRHLLAVEAAGLLLLVALVGSIAIVSRGAADAGTAGGRAAT